MSRALIRLRPDGIHEIVRPLPARRFAFALGALLVVCALGLAGAAALFVFHGTPRALLGGAALAMTASLGLLVRSRLRGTAGPLAVTIPLHDASRRGAPVAPRTGGARDTGR